MGSFERLSGEIGDDPGESLLLVIERLASVEQESDGADHVTPCPERQRHRRLHVAGQKSRAVGELDQRRPIDRQDDLPRSCSSREQRVLLKIELSLGPANVCRDPGQIDNRELLALHEAERHAVCRQDVRCVQ